MKNVMVACDWRRCSLQQGIPCTQTWQQDIQCRATCMPRAAQALCTSLLDFALLSCITYHTLFIAIYLTKMNTFPRFVYSTLKLSSVYASLQKPPDVSGLPFEMSCMRHTSSLHEALMRAAEAHCTGT